jgi:hypothetical protein
MAFMNGARKQARRYHWLSEGLTSFVDDPHTAIDGKGQGEIVNLADRRAEASRCAQLDLLFSLGPDKIAREFSALAASGEQQAKAPAAQPLLPHLIMSAHHDVRSSDVIARRLHGNLAAAADRGPKDFIDLLLTPGVGARTVKALAMVAEVMHGAPCRFTDPARFSIAHGGKDRHPFPVSIKVYDETIKVLKSACRKRSSAAMKNSVHCGAWTINPVSSSGTPPVHPSRNSLRKSLATRIPTVAAPFSDGSRRQQIPLIESKQCRSSRCRADRADGSPRCAISTGAARPTKVAAIALANKIARMAWVAHRDRSCSGT